MCYQVVELYAVCKCLYYQHAVDRCAAYGQPGHYPHKKEVLVGHSCGIHSRRSGHSYGASHYSDSGYSSSHSPKSSSRGHYR
ncbi:hypothetical protein GE21DRAFT_7871 [Neurospora crassa]|uniref:Uncharacterized protein n=2 Tax=Neurospora TaxID=5140 RepID=V5IN63_NEUCR|nr:hypothetical protein NCU06641 [Neurospora crassa OR74A]ESA42579.1 hypothetical protein NCU06641 [Neurospora crassa OR74A]KHE86907.1 hypothetical protein GE21DRAFT_7871 [Neurospora crassa]|eukprot:XP_011394686.1 hypothetical protein NCU06641 [Neurospora crassa OR74A]